MKRPHGYGCVKDLGKNRRNRYAAVVTDYEASKIPDKDGQRTQKKRYLGYYPTKEEAYRALEIYNKNKAPISYMDMTFGDIWAEWAERNLKRGSKSRAVAYAAAIKKCSPIFDKKMTAIRLADLQDIVDAYAGTSKSSLNNIKIVMSFVFEWAFKNDIIQKDYSKFVDICPKETENHRPLTHKQVDDLIALKAPNITQKIILMYLFTGARPSELFNLKKEDIHLQEQYFHIHQAKTSAGIRIVPIADKILPLFKEFYQKPSKKLFDMSIAEYRTEFCKLYSGHTPHDTRTTFISFMTEKDVQQIITQKIVGHSNGTVTGDVYTKLTLQPLLEAVNKL